MNPSEEFKAPGRLLKLKDVVAETSLGVSTIYRRMKEGTFPTNRHLGGGRVAWIEADIREWKQRAINGELLPHPDGIIDVNARDQQN